MSRASVWQVARSVVHLDREPSVLGISRGAYLDRFGLASGAIVCGLAVAVAWRRRRDAELGGGVALSLTTYLVAGIYVLPWYGMWLLPAACLARARRTLVYVASLGAYLGPLIFLVAFVPVGLSRADRADTELLANSGASGSRMPLINTRPSAP